MAAKLPVIPADEWAGWPDEKLLDLHVCQLGIGIEGSTLEPRLAELDQDLQSRGLAGFHPHYWLSDEWFTPDGVPGVAIPFYLAHPRLEKLRRRRVTPRRLGGHGAGRRAAQQRRHADASKNLMDDARHARGLRRGRQYTRRRRPPRSNDSPILHPFCIHPSRRLAESRTNASPPRPAESQCAARHIDDSSLSDR